MKRIGFLLTGALMILGALSLFNKTQKPHHMGPVAETFVKSSQPAVQTQPLTSAPVAVQKVSSQEVKQASKSEREKFIKNWVAYQAAQVEKIQSNPHLIDLEIESLAKNLHPAEAMTLAKRAISADETRGARMLIVDVLSRQPQKFKEALTTVLAREVAIDLKSALPHTIAESDVRFESSLSLQALLSIEPLLFKDKELAAKLVAVMRSQKTFMPTREQLRASLHFAGKGQLYWTQHAQNLMQGDVR